MAKRLLLDTALREILGSKNVYFQPPSNIRMHYPAIRYYLSKLPIRSADNRAYLINETYTVMFITDDPDDPRIQKFAELKHCALDRTYVADNLNHYVYTINI